MVACALFEPLLLLSSRTGNGSLSWNEIEEKAKFDEVYAIEKNNNNNNKLSYKNKTKTKQNKETKKRVFILYKDAIMLHISDFL